jgi:hypothetical protein
VPVSAKGEKKTPNARMTGRELRRKLGFVSPVSIEKESLPKPMPVASQVARANEMRMSTPPAVKAVRKKLSVPETESISSVLLFSEQVGKFSALSDNGAEVIAAFIDGGCHVGK